MTWVVSCNADAATNKTLPSVVTIDGQAFSVDSKEYRIAKFRKEAADHMIVDSVMWHVLITLVFSQVDNRAKNTFWGYSKVSGKWNLCFAYDNDTAMGNDNEGGLTLKYGYMDYDKIGTRDVFNAADATVFQMMWKAFPQELASMYINRENAGAWDLDAFADHCEEIQSLAAESLWIEDVWRKDIKTYTVLGTSAYIPMLNGQKRLQRRQFLHYQRAFMSSYFISPYATAESATIRGYTPTSGNLVIECRELQGAVNGFKFYASENWVGRTSVNDAGGPGHGISQCGGIDFDFHVRLFPSSVLLKNILAVGWFFCLRA